MSFAATRELMLGDDAADAFVKLGEMDEDQAGADGDGDDFEWEDVEANGAAGMESIPTK